MCGEVFVLLSHSVSPMKGGESMTCPFCAVVFSYRPWADRERFILRTGGESSVCDRCSLCHGSRATQHAQGSVSWEGRPLLQDGYHQWYTAAQVHPQRQLHRYVPQIQVGTCVHQARWWEWIDFFFYLFKKDDKVPGKTLSSNIMHAYGK